MTRTVLAIDAGQTGIKVRVCDGPESTDLLFRGIDTHGALLPQLADVVREASARTGTTPEIVAAGVSGLTDRDADPAALLGLVSGSGVRRVDLAHDSTTSFLGALGDRHGAVVASGTGVVTLAVGASDVARVDGWGYLMGDAGSGHWLGREALDAVMRAYDGRGPATGLTDRVQAVWPDLAQAYMALQADESRVSVVAGFAADVAQLADQGDAVALDITARAAAELALSVRTAIARVRTGDESVAVCALGGVFRSTPLRTVFERTVTADVAGAEIVERRGDGIDGALALVDLAPEHPLTAVVHRAAAS